MDEERLVVALEARIRDFERNMQRASREAAKNFDVIETRAKESGNRLEKIMASASSRIGDGFKTFGAGIIGGLTAGGIEAVVSKIGEVAHGVAEIGDQAKRAGLSVKAFQELRYVGQQNRIDVDGMVDGLKELQVRAQEFVITAGGPAADTLKQLGYSAGELKEKLKDPSALFSEIIGKIGQLDKAAQLKALADMFGDTGAEQFVLLLGQGEAGMRKLIQAAHDTGAVMDEELIAKAAELDRKFQAVTTTVSTGFKTAIVESAAALSALIVKLQSFYDKYKEARGAVEAGELVGSMVGLPGQSAYRGMSADALDKERDGILAKMKALQDANPGRFLPAVAEKELAALQKQLRAVEAQIEAQKKLTAAKQETNEATAEGTRLQEVVVTSPKSSTGGPARYPSPYQPRLPDNVDVSLEHREDPLLFGDPEKIGDAVLRRQHAMAMSQMNRLLEQVERGRKTYDDNARKWYGATREEWREASREAYAERIMEAEGRPVRAYTRPALMSEEDRAEHRRRKEREKKARLRAKQSK